MKCYKVGGAVRDKLLGKTVKERDWVVVGATPEMMEARGYKPVGKDFPVFLHPETGEEYALARTERKSGHGYKGFTFYTGTDVTLEDDLGRRDFTINAMAEDEKGQIIDPYNGQKDLQNKTLKHVSKAFSEDPLRILRGARFAAKLPEFHIDPSTNELMKTMVDNSEVKYLEPQRVWKEIEKALDEHAPYRFFAVLDDCGAFSELFDTNLEAEQAIKRVKNTKALTHKPTVLWAAFLYPAGTATVRSINDAYNVAKRFAELARLAAISHDFWQQLYDSDAETFVKWLEKADAYRRPERFYELTLVCRANEDDGYDKSILCRKAFEITREVQARPFIDQGYQGARIGQAMRDEKIKRLRGLLTTDEGQ